MDIGKILSKNRVILKGHFLLTSGLHSEIYFEKFRLLEKPNLTRKLIKTKINELKALEPTICIGPLTGGALVAFAVADLLKTKAYYMEKDDKGNFILKRDFLISPEDKILLCDDVLTTGSSFVKMLETLKSFSNQIVGYFVLIDRSEELSTNLSPIYSIYKTRVKTFTQEDCPLCKKDIPLQKRGSGFPTLPK